MAKKKPSLEVLETAIDEATPTPKRYNLSSGSPLLNLAITGDARYATGPSVYSFSVGESGSGKTYLTLTQFAEAAQNPEYDDYEFYYLDGENGAFFEFKRYFGKKAAARIQVIPVTHTEEVYDFLEKKGKEGVKFIAIVDSMDSLTTEAADKKLAEQAKARENDKEITGSFGDGKAKINSDRLKRILHQMEKSGSVLQIICQTRDNVGGGLFDPKKIRSGGHAVKFCAHVEVWTSAGKKITKEVNGKERVIGRYITCKVMKNRMNGAERTVEIPFYPNIGLDNVGGMIDFLIAEKVWEAPKGRIACPFYETTHFREDLIAKIEDDNKEDDLCDAVQAAWSEIEDKLRVTRKPRYD